MPREITGQQSEVKANRGEIKKFEQVLIKEGELVNKISKKYQQGEYSKKTVSKQGLQLLEDFKKVYDERRRLQKIVLPNEFIEDERVGFGGKGENILEIIPDENYSNVDKYFLKIAQAIELTEQFKIK